MRHTHDPQDRSTRCTAVSTPPPFRHLVSGAANPKPPFIDGGDDVDVDLDVDLDVDMDIQSDDSADPPSITDSVRSERRAWSSVPKVATPAEPSAPACPLRDRRRSYRHRVALPVELRVLGASAAPGAAPVPHAATTRMLSFGGAFIESDLRPAFASRVSLTFEVPGHDVTVHVTGVVRWSDARGFGVQFDGLRAQAVWVLGKYFAGL
jgi:hypothetical protein